MEFSFHKMHGLGNDFVVINMTQKEFPLGGDFIQKIANRKTGIGCDQVLILKKPQRTNADFFYQIFNADGTEVGQCGNGARCISLLIEMENITLKKTHKLHTLSTELTIENLGNGLHQVEFPSITTSSSRQQILFNEQPISYRTAQLGNPHVIINQHTLKGLPPEAVARFINQHKRFPTGANVNFYTIESEHAVTLEVFERGVGFTLACGSGACATYAILQQQHPSPRPIKIHQPGGTLIFQRDPKSNAIQMIGPAQGVFHGEWRSAL